MGTDVFGWYQMSAQGGHAGPASSSAYIHQIEHACAMVSVNARPNAWLPAHLEGVTATAFEDIGASLLGVRSPVPPRMATVQSARTTNEIGLLMRESIIWRVAGGLKLESIASEFNVSVDLVSALVEEMTQAMLQMQFVKQDVMLSVRKQCMAVSAYSLWARSARQEKFQFFAKHLDDSINRQNFRSMLQLWQDWSLCKDEEFLALVNPRPAARIVSLLLKAGATRRSLAVSSVKGAAPLSNQIKQLEIPNAGPCSVRGNRAAHRLVLTPRDVDASKARGATISMLGFHWWMLLLGSVLIAKEEI